MRDDRLILVLSEHPVFSWKLNVYAAQTLSSGSLQIVGTPDIKQEEKRGTPAEITQMLRLAEEVSDKALMKAFSKKKSLADFKKEVTPGMLEKYIRPRIETVNRKIIDLAKQSDLKVFQRYELSNTVLFDRYRIHILPSPTTCTFHFVKDQDGLKYFISLANEGNEITLQDKQHIVISDQPCIVLSGEEIHQVENISSKKLSPFFTKEYITVPPASEKLYLKGFVLKTMLEYEVKTEGIQISKITPPRQAFLTLERDLSLDLVLRLSFGYNNDTRIDANYKRNKVVQIEEQNGEIGFLTYQRDTAWENRLNKKLQKLGLIQKGTAHFYLENTANPFGLIEWINKNEHHALNDFIIEQNLDHDYFTGPISIKSDFEDKIDWFEVNIEVLIGDYKIPFSRFRKHILSGNNQFILPDKTVAILPAEWFEKYQDLFRYSNPEESGIQVKKIHAPLLAHALEGDGQYKKFDNISDIIQIPAVKPVLPVQLATNLREYQKEGFYWLAHLYNNGFGGCLADDMGLGKTLQTITLLQYIYANSEQKTAVNPDGQFSLFETTQPALPASLVVVPTSLLHNWKNELKRFAPELKTYIYAGNKRAKTRNLSKIFRRYQIIITSYGTMRNDIEYLQEYPFHMIILDESQYIKNPTSLSYQSVMQLSAPHRLALTGTPIENSLDDLWAQFNFINEGLLGSLSSFRKEFVQKIVKEKNEEREEMLKKMISPFLLRRTKEEVTPELPPLLQEIIYCDMTEAQETIYENEKNRIRNTLLEAKEHPGSSNNNFIALEGLNKLRQLANHPKLVITDYTGSSGKFEQIIESFESLKASNHKVLIFSSYVSHLQLLADKFNKEGWKYAMLTGETQKREEEINRFTVNEDIHCFFISLKAGSTGLNLTSADYVFIIDPWWNPAAEMQALSRAHRIGQEKPVIAYRFISGETVEEKIIRLQETKSELFDTFVTSSNPLAGLNWEELF